MVFKTSSHCSVFAISLFFVVIDGSSEVCMVVKFSLLPRGKYIFVASKDASFIASVEC